MRKKIICDCFNLGRERLYNGELLMQGEDCGHNTIKLENGIFLKAVGDGRYYKDNDESSKWAEVIEYDDELEQSVAFLGYVEL